MRASTWDGHGRLFDPRKIDGPSRRRRKAPCMCMCTSAALLLPSYSGQSTSPGLSASYYYSKLTKARSLVNNSSNQPQTRSAKAALSFSGLSPAHARSKPSERQKGLHARAPKLNYDLAAADLPLDSRSISWPVDAWIELSPRPAPYITCSRDRRVARESVCVVTLSQLLWRIGLMWEVGALHVSSATFFSRVRGA